MIHQELNNHKSKILKHIKNKRLQNAFNELRLYASELNSWEFNDEINRIEDSYRMMLKYTIDGINDPHRADVYDSIIDAIYRLVDVATRESLKKKQSSKIYFSTLRFLDIQHDGSLSQMIAAYSQRSENISLYNIAAGVSEQGNLNKLRVSLEQLESRIFNKLWVAFPLNTEDVTTVDMALFSSALPSHFKHLLISALLLGLIEYYDESRIHLLLNVYQNGDEATKIKALCAVLIAMSIHNERLTGKKLLNHIAAIKELPQWHDDLKMVFLQLIRTRDTERISRKMQDELLPEMMKLRPDIYKKINDSSSILDMQSIEENPEWQEMLENSGIADKMKELSEMQQDGSDVFMSTFAHLKSYPFFSTASNWFLPFLLEQTEVADALGANGMILGELIASSPFLCNSDKYSFALSMKSVPDEQRQLMLSQLNAQNLNVAELQSAELMNTEKSRENTANKYIQDLYRFFKLFRYKKDFYDPFAGAMNLANIKILAEEFDDVDTLSFLGEFYFNRKYYNDAFALFDKLQHKIPPSAQLFQKMGYALQQHNDTPGALKYYEQSELLNAESLWTLRRIAVCHKLMGNTEKALSYYKRIESVKNDDTTVAMNIGHCLMELGKCDEALKYYYKVEFLDEKPMRAWRPIAWCSLISNELTQSRAYYKRILESNPTAADFLNMGHLELVSGNFHEAVKRYNDSIASDNGNTENFVSSFYSDAKYLTKSGVQKDLLPFIIDAVLYGNNH